MKKLNFWDFEETKASPSHHLAPPLNGSTSCDNEEGFTPYFIRSHL